MDTRHGIDAKAGRWSYVIRSRTANPEVSTERKSQLIMIFHPEGGGLVSIGAKTLELVASKQGRWNVLGLIPEFTEDSEPRPCEKCGPGV